MSDPVKEALYEKLRGYLNVARADIQIAVNTMATGAGNAAVCRVRANLNRALKLLEETSRHRPEEEKR